MLFAYLLLAVNIIEPVDDDTVYQNPNDPDGRPFDFSLGVPDLLMGGVTQNADLFDDVADEDSVDKLFDELDEIDENDADDDDADDDGDDADDDDADDDDADDADDDGDDADDDEPIGDRISGDDYEMGLISSY